jgi:TolB protein
MTREGSRIKRISFVSGYSTSPAWSPDGNYIAYVFLKGGNYGIAVYEVSTGETSIIGELLGSEDLSWAPNSRHIVYSNIRMRPSTVMVIDILTREKRRLTNAAYNAFSPNWGSD